MESLEEYKYMLLEKFGFDKDGLEYSHRLLIEFGVDLETLKYGLFFKPDSDNLITLKRWIHGLVLDWFKFSFGEYLNINNVVRENTCVGSVEFFEFLTPKVEKIYEYKKYIVDLLNSRKDIEVPSYVETWLKYLDIGGSKNEKFEEFLKISFDMYHVGLGTMEFNKDLFYVGIPEYNISRNSWEINQYYPNHYDNDIIRIGCTRFRIYGIPVKISDNLEAKEKYDKYISDVSKKWHILK